MPGDSCSADTETEAVKSVPTEESFQPGSLTLDRPFSCLNGSGVPQLPGRLPPPPCAFYRAVFWLQDTGICSVGRLQSDAGQSDGWLEFASASLLEKRGYSGPFVEEA